MAAFIASLRSGTVQVFHYYQDIPPEVWNRFYGANWKDHRFLQIVEETLQGDFDYFYLALLDGTGEFVALQPGFITTQDLALGFPSILRRGVHLVRNFYQSFLIPGMAFLGSPASGGVLVDEAARDAIAEGLQNYAATRGISLLTFKDFPLAQREVLRDLQKQGYTTIASYPAVTLKLEFSSFDDYLAKKVGKATRKAIRRKFRSLAEKPTIRMECVHDIAPWLARIEHLYLQVFERSSEKFEKLNAGFFQRVAERLADRVRYFLWWQEERLIAFSLCFVHEGVFYDDYLGMDDAVANDLHLYYLTFRDQLTWALAQGLHSYYSTPMSYEPKLRLGFRLVPLDLYVRHTSPWLNYLYRPLAKAFAPTLDDPILKQFSNYHDLSPT